MAKIREGSKSFLGHGLEKLTGKPLDVAGFLPDELRGVIVRVRVHAGLLKLDVAHSDEKAREFGHWCDAPGLQFEFAGADAVFDPEDLLGAALQDLEATIVVG